MRQNKTFSNDVFGFINFSHPLFIITIKFTLNKKNVFKLLCKSDIITNSSFIFILVYCFLKKIAIYFGIKREFNYFIDLGDEDEKQKIYFSLYFYFDFYYPDWGFNVCAFEVDSKAAILIDTKTNTVIYQKNINGAISPGAFTKLMTAIVVMENSKPDDSVTITQDILSKMKDGQNYVTFYAGEVLSVKDLLHCMVLDSSNLASYALALHISGSEEEFANLMNEKAKLIGATNTNFINSYGLHEQNQYSTVWDCYVISEYATRDQNLMDILNAQQYTIAASSFRPKGTLFIQIII